MTPAEKCYVRTAFWHILFGIPQMFILYSFVTSAEFIIAATFEPWTAIIIWAVCACPLYILAIHLGIRGHDKEDRRNHKQMIVECTPFRYLVPIWQFHAGFVILTRMAFVTFVRKVFHKPDFRANDPYILFNTNWQLGIRR